MRRLFSPYFANSSSKVLVLVQAKGRTLTKEAVLKGSYYSKEA